MARRTFWIVSLLIAGCSTGEPALPPGSGELLARCPVAEPVLHGACTTAAEGLACTYSQPDASRHDYLCQAGRWLGNTCDFAGRYPPVDVYSCTRDCAMDTSEWSITCRCLLPEHLGICCGSRSLDETSCEPARIKDGSPCCPGAACASGLSCRCGPDARWHC